MDLSFGKRNAAMTQKGRLQDWGYILRYTVLEIQDRKMASIGFVYFRSDVKLQGKPSLHISLTYVSTSKSNRVCLGNADHATCV